MTLLAEHHPDRIAATSAIVKWQNDVLWHQLQWWLWGGPVAVGTTTYHHRGLVRTMDEHDQLTPYKRLPDLAYLRQVAWTWVYEPLLLVAKSRQIMMTWLFSAIAAQQVFTPARRVAFICKKFESADANLERVNTIVNNLPPGLGNPQVDRIKGYLSCPATGSLIQAVDENAEKALRQFTFSWIYSDESSFQANLDEQYKAALPTVKGGGRYTGVSTPNGQDTFHGYLSNQGEIELVPGRPPLPAHDPAVVEPAHHS